MHVFHPYSLDFPALRVPPSLPDVIIVDDLNSIVVFIVLYPCRSWYARWGFGVVSFSPPPLCTYLPPLHPLIFKKTFRASLVPHQFHTKMARYLATLGHSQRGLKLEGLPSWRRLYLAVEFNLPEDASRILHSIYVELLEVDIHNHPLAPRLLDFAFAVAHIGTVHTLFQTRS